MHTKSLALLQQQLLRTALLREAAAAPLPATSPSGPVGDVPGATRAALDGWATSAGRDATRNSERSQMRPEVQLGCNGWDGSVPMRGFAASLESAGQRPASRGDRVDTRSPESAQGGLRDSGCKPNRTGGGQSSRDAAGDRGTPDSAGGVPGSRGGAPGAPISHQAMGGPSKAHAGGGRGTPDSAEGGPGNREGGSSSAVDALGSRENCLDRHNSGTAEGRPGCWHSGIGSDLEGPGERGDCLAMGGPGIAERGLSNGVGGTGSAVNGPGSSSTCLDGRNLGNGEGGCGSKLGGYNGVSGVATAIVVRLGERAVELGSAGGGAALQRAAAKHGDIEGANTFIHGIHGEKMRLTTGGAAL